MKIAPFVFALIIVTFLFGCESMNRSLVQNLSHMAGGITQQDLSMESFKKQTSSSSGKHMLLIYCNVREVKDEWEWWHIKEKPAPQPPGKASMQAALNILDSALNYSRSELGWEPTMAMLVFPENGSYQIYSLNTNAGIPIYLASSYAVEGGALLHDDINSNTLKLAEMIDEKRKVFPYEAETIEFGELDEYNDRNIDLNEGLKGGAKSSENVDELHRLQRANFLRAITLKWPSLLPDAKGASDILYISWEGRYGNIPPTRKENAPWTGTFKIALVNMKDNVLYYFKKKAYYQSLDHLKEPSKRLIYELERIQKIRSRP